MRVIIILFSIGLFALQGIAAEQSPLVSQKEASFWQSAWGGIKEPFVSESRKYLIGGTLATLSLLATRNDTIDPFQESVSTRKPLGGSASVFRLVGEWVPNLAYIGAMTFDGWYNQNSQSYYRSRLMIRTMGSACFLTLSLKLITQQHRPAEGANNLSFPSGHTTTAFVFASVVGSEHGWKWGIPAYALATVGGFSRINDNRHFLHDVVMGAAIGTAYGTALSRSGRKSFAKKRGDSSRFFWAPYVLAGESGVTATLSY